MSAVSSPSTDLETRPTKWQFYVFVLLGMTEVSGLVTAYTRLPTVSESHNEHELDTVGGLCIDTNYTCT